MSLSNTPTDEFKPLAVHSLDTFNDEVRTANENVEPDFERFKLLIEKPKFGQEEEKIDFEALYKPPEEVEEVIFKPLIQKKLSQSEKDAIAKDAAVSEDGIDPDEEPEPQETLEEIGYREGVEKGFKVGEQKGYDAGFEKGMAEGDAKGFEQGQEKGLQAGKEEGYEQGLEQGEAQGLEQTREQAQKIVNSLEDAVNKTDQTLGKLVDIYEERIIQLIEQIARKAVLAQIEIDEEIVKPMVIEALNNLVQPEDVVLNVSTEDYEYVDMIKDQFFDQIESLNNVSVRSDPAIMRGGCKIETSTATVSTDPETRLQEIFEAMKNAGAA